MTGSKRKKLERVPSFSAFETWDDKAPIGNSFDRKKQKKTGLDEKEWDQGQLDLITAPVVDLYEQRWPVFLLHVLTCFSGTMPLWARILRRLQTKSPILFIPLIIVDSCLRGVPQVPQTQKSQDNLLTQSSR
jgi:hypothetical protein